MGSGMRRYDTSALKVSIEELLRIAGETYGDLIKAVVDVAQGVLLLDMELHADGEAALLDGGSRQEDIWGINLYPGSYGSPDFIEFDSMINIRPRQGNRTRGVDDPVLVQRISEIVYGVVEQ
jgi:hypothetical protein